MLNPILHPITPQFHLPTRASQDLFNWSPEFDRGGAEYEKAATIYKNFKEWAKAIYAYTKCAEANDKAGLPTKVASALDFKAGCLRDAGQVNAFRGWCYVHCIGSISVFLQIAEAVQCYKEASGAYMRKPVTLQSCFAHSFPDSISQIWQDYDNASSVLSKAAKLMADTDGRAACDLFIAAMDIMKVRRSPGPGPLRS